MLERLSASGDLAGAVPGVRADPALGAGLGALAGRAGPGPGPAAPRGPQARGKGRGPPAPPRARRSSATRLRGRAPSAAAYGPASPPGAVRLPCASARRTGLRGAAPRIPARRPARRRAGRSSSPWPRPWVDPRLLDGLVARESASAGHSLAGRLQGTRATKWSLGGGRSILVSE